MEIQLPKQQATDDLRGRYNRQLGRHRAHIGADASLVRR